MKSTQRHHVQPVIFGYCRHRWPAVGRPAPPGLAYRHASSKRRTWSRWATVKLSHTAPDGACTAIFCFMFLATGLINWFFCARSGRMEQPHPLFVYTTSILSILLALAPLCMPKIKTFIVSKIKRLKAWDESYKQLLKNAPLSFRINSCLFFHIIKLINFFVYFGFSLTYLSLAFVAYMNRYKISSRFGFYAAGFFGILSMGSVLRCILSYIKSIKKLMEIEQNKNEYGQEPPANSIVFNVKEKWDN